MKYFFFFILLFNLPVEGKIIFSCITEQQKTLQIKSTENGYVYSFGKPDNPELVFFNPKQQVISQTPPGDGIGNVVWRHMLMRNRQYTYRVFFFYDRQSEWRPMRYGVEILRGQRSLSVLLCSENYPILEEFDSEFMN